MKICAISDLHGYLPNNIEESDLLLIAGDLIPLDIQSSYSLSEEWFEVDFNNWIASLPVDKVIIVGGNHDGFIDDKCLLFRDILSSKCIYLEDELYEYNGIKYGVYNAKYLENEETILKSRKVNCFISVIITNNKYNGLSISNGDKLKECVENTNKTIDKFYDRIIKYRDSEEI